MILFRKAVLMVHGYAGGTYDEEPLAISLEKYWNMDVYTFTLPGHQKRSVKTQKYSEWLEASEDMLKKIKSFGYKDIYLVGHSMGGIIATYLANKYSYVKKLVLVAPAFRYFVNKDDASTISIIKSGVVAAKTADKGELFTRFLKLPLSSFGEFTKLVSEYKDIIEEVKIPVLIVQGKDDNLVPFQSSIELIDRIKSKNKKLLLLDNTTHDVFKTEGCEKAIEEIERFLR